MRRQTQERGPQQIGDLDRFETSLSYELAQDPAWRPLMRGRALTAAERAEWRRHLDERGDVRGEVLALAEELAAEPPPGEAEREVFEAKRVRLALLLRDVDPLWWSLARAIPDLLNCGLARGLEARVRFAFVCPRSWEELTPTSEAGVRHCGACGEHVYKVETLVAAEELARRGSCIAVPAQLAERGGYPSGNHKMMTGRPEHPVPRWGRRLFGDGSDTD